MNQHTEVLNHLKKNIGITSKDAFILYGVTRLSAIIFDLRKEHEIEDKREKGLNRFGHHVSWKIYYMGDK